MSTRLTRANASSELELLVAGFRSTRSADKAQSKAEANNVIDYDDMVSARPNLTWDQAKQLATDKAEEATVAGLVKRGAERKAFATHVRNNLNRAMKRAGLIGRDEVKRYLTRDGLNAILADSGFASDLIDYLADMPDVEVARKLLADLESAS